MIEPQLACRGHELVGTDPGVAFGELLGSLVGSLEPLFDREPEPALHRIVDRAQARAHRGLGGLEVLGLDRPGDDAGELRGDDRFALLCTAFLESGVHEEQSLRALG